MPLFRHAHLYLRGFVAVLAGIGALRPVAVGRNGTITRSAALIVAPTIQRAPFSVTEATGRNVVFTVEAIGTAPLTYGWEFDGVPIRGATAPWLFLSNVNTAQTGTYTVRVSNAHGTATSAATLTVLPVPVGTHRMQTKRRSRGFQGIACFPGA